LPLNQLLRERRGVALPLTLLALLVISFLGVSGVLLSGSELAVATAHQGATQQLYLAERGIEHHVATLAGNSAAPAVGETTLNLTGGRHPVVVNVAELGRSVSGEVATTYYSATSAVRLPSGEHGRTLMALFNRLQSITTGSLGITSAATFGGDVLIDGSITLSGKQTATKCAIDSTKASMTTLRGGRSTLKTDSAKALPHGHEILDMNRAELKNRVLGSLTMQDLFNRAQIKFPYNNIQAGNQITVGGYSATKPESKGPLATTVSTGQKVSPVRVTTYLAGSSHPYNWGCPYTTLGNTGCDWTRADTAFYPIVGIDARNGVVTLSGDHGQGLLVVINGNLSIGSTFYFKGVMLVEGELDINSSARVDGAVVAFEGVDVVNDDDVSTIGGSTIITYDQCAIDKVNTLLNSGSTSTPQTTITPTFAWRELLR
jgi:hypothetical protein